MRTFKENVSFKNFDCPTADAKLTNSDFASIEKFADKLFAKINTDVVFTKHFKERVNDARNKKQISSCELMVIFTEVFQKFAGKIKMVDDDIERLIKSLSTSINIPVAIQWDRGKKELKMIAKTAMRKKDFKSRDQKYTVESSSILPFRQFLNEGGNAIANVVPIHQENVGDTMNVIYKKLLPILGIKKSDTALLGSTGKKNPHSSSGDIDMAVSISALMASNKSAKTMSDLLDVVYSKSKGVANEVKQLKGIGIVTMGFPISNSDGKQKNEIVQLDLMLTDNVEFASWMYFSPHQKDSPWKGLYRNSMLSAISHYADRVGNEEEWSRYLLHFNNGLGRVKETRKGKRGLLKNAKIIERETPVKNADEIVKILLGKSFKAKDILTWNNVFDAFTSSKFQWKKHRKAIAKLVVMDITKKNYPVPKEIAKIAGL